MGHVVAWVGSLRVTEIMNDIASIIFGLLAYILNKQGYKERV